jgi:hypothetical protein
LRRTVDSVASLQRQQLQAQQHLRTSSPDVGAPVDAASAHSFSVRFSDDVAQVITPKSISFA